MADRREFLMLAHPFNPVKHFVCGWFLSEKMDGMRCWWDGGVSRGKFADMVPWANTEKDGRLRTRPIATGLWSRYGKVIYAPQWWLDSLPPISLDGELYAGRGKFQTTTSIVKRYDSDPILWREIRFAVFDAPTIDQVLQDGRINLTFYKKEIGQPARSWAVTSPIELIEPTTTVQLSYERMVDWLRERLEGNAVAYAMEQTRLPFTTQAAISQIEDRLAEINAGRGEGVMLRKHTSIWTPRRSNDLLKYKPYLDDEATVTGYVWGRETDKGSKLLGLMGALIVDWKGKRFEISGFTEAERAICYKIGGGYDHAHENGAAHPGQPIDPVFHNPTFPIGSTVTFRYRELSDGGIPKEARFLRKAEA